jgi:RHS repeat-associated protein
VVQETDGNGITQVSSVLGDDELLAQARSGAVSYYLEDGQGNVRLLTDGNGAITDRYTYDAYGNLLSSQGTTVNPYRYTGQQLDSLTGLYDLRARYYDPTSGRFLSRDTAGIDVSNPVEVNRYSYAQDDPINLIDPSGHGEEEEEGGLYAIILGAVRTAGAGVGRLIPRLTEEEIAILLAGLGALGLRFLLQWLATHTVTLPRAATQAATATPSSDCPADPNEADYDQYPGVHGLVRGPSNDGGTQPCHINAEVGVKFESSTNLHLNYIGGGEYTSNGTAIGTCNDEFDCVAASVVSSVLGTILGKKALVKPSQKQTAITQAVQWFYDELWPRLLALKNYTPGAWKGTPTPLPTP